MLLNSKIVNKGWKLKSFDLLSVQGESLNQETLFKYI